MSVLIFIDHSEGQIKKASLEALSYGAALATQLGTTAEGILLGTVNTDLSTLGKYGIKKVHQAVVKKNVISGKAFAHIGLSSPIKVIALNPNSYAVKEGEGAADVAPLSATGG